jgi:vacuolar-type H+-ATPase subunit F/Vma7
MSVQLRALCRPEIAAGFALAGISAIEAETAGEAASRVRELLDDPSIGVVLLDNAFHERLDEDLRRQLARRPLPMVVPFPGIEWEARPDAADSYIVELLRRVIGYRVRLR